MKIKKQLTGLCLVLISCLYLLTGCTANSKNEENIENSAKVAVDSNDDGSVRSDLTSVELVQLMGNGINLGNTMEAYGHLSLGTQAAVSAYETLWGCPVTTQEMIKAMREAGFTTLRIPVAWTNMMDYENGDYTIDEAYLNRVEEIVNYARNEEMYVILNDHWDGSWWGMFGSANEGTRKASMDLYTSMWTQIAEKFSAYSDYVIFESANEELGNRLNDVDVAKDSGTLSEDECYELTNKINQTFVDLIRNSGGNNKERFLLIAGYNTMINNTCDERFIMPTDSIDQKLMISVHFYEPDGYCMRDSLLTWGTSEHYENMNDALKKMRKFISEGYGVVIGEYGVLINSLGEIKSNTVDYYTYFLNACTSYGYCPVLWDTNAAFNRSNLGFIDDEVASLYLEYQVENEEGKTQEELATAARQIMNNTFENATPSAGTVADDVAMAWIMYNSSDWNTLYSVGDVYDSTNMTVGTIPTDVEIIGAGTYTVALDFSGTAAGYANSVIFSALGITNGENLYPGYVISIDEVKVNGARYELAGNEYTSSDDKICTRVNLYNEWVTAIPDDVRTKDSNNEGITPKLLDPENLGNVETIEITFTYEPAN